MYFRIGKYFFGSTEIRDHQQDSPNPIQKGKLDYPDQSARWYISERLLRTIWMKTDGPQKHFYGKSWSFDHLNLVSMITHGGRILKDSSMMTHGGTILKDSCKIGQFLAFCSHFHPAIIRNLDGLIQTIGHNVPTINFCQRIRAKSDSKAE